MKKFTKSDFKKMALMGIAGGTMLASQTPATVDAASADYSNALAAHGCQSRQGCQSVPPEGNLQAYRNVPHQYSNQYYYDNTPAQAGCGVPQAMYPQTPNSYYQGQPMQPQFSAGCGGFNAPQGQPLPPQPIAGCGGLRAPQGQQMPPQVIAGCAGNRAPQNPSSQSATRNTYSQWETADTTSPESNSKWQK